MNNSGRKNALPAQLQARTYAQGNHIHLAPGREANLFHESWHAALQKQGRVQPEKHMAADAGIISSSGLAPETDAKAKRAAHGTFNK